MLAQPNKDVEAFSVKYEMLSTTLTTLKRISQVVRHPWRFLFVGFASSAMVCCMEYSAFTEKGMVDPMDGL